MLSPLPQEDLLVGVEGIDNQRKQLVNISRERESLGSFAHVSEGMYFRVSELRFKGNEFCGKQGFGWSEGSTFEAFLSLSKLRRRAENGDLFFFVKKGAVGEYTVQYRVKKEEKPPKFLPR